MYKLISVFIAALVVGGAVAHPDPATILPEGATCRFSLAKAL